jgi:hypothetical protein
LGGGQRSFASNQQRDKNGGETSFPLEPVMAHAATFSVSSSTSAVNRTNAAANRQGRPLECLVLFAGCGVTSLGLHHARLAHVAMIEANDIACRTLRANLLGVEEDEKVPTVLELDVRSVNFETCRGIDFVSGAPPCQPFSNGGFGKG